MLLMYTVVSCSYTALSLSLIKGCGGWEGGGGGGGGMDEAGGCATQGHFTEDTYVKWPF